MGPYHVLSELDHQILLSKFTNMVSDLQISDQLLIVRLIDCILNNSFLLPVKATMIMDGWHARQYENLKHQRFHISTFIIDFILNNMKMIPNIPGNGTEN